MFIKHLVDRVVFVTVRVTFFSSDWLLALHIDLLSKLRRVGKIEQLSLLEGWQS